MSAWILLALAIALEVTGTFLLKLSHGFEKWHWGVLAIISFTGCFWVMAPAIKVIPVGVAYALWAGIGIMAITLIGFLVFDEHLKSIQLACIGLIAVGAIGLRVTTTAGVT